MSERDSEDTGSGHSETERSARRLGQPARAPKPARPRPDAATSATDRAVRGAEPEPVDALQHPNPTTSPPASGHGATRPTRAGAELGRPTRRVKTSTQGFTEEQRARFSAELPPHSRAADLDASRLIAERLTSAESGVRSLFRNSFFLLTLGALLAFLLLLVITQTLIALDSLRAITEGIRGVGVAVEVLIYLLLAIIVAFVARIGWFFIGLRRSRRFRIPTAEAMRERASLRAKSSRARQDLTRYVREYVDRNLAGLGFTSDECARLQEDARLLQQSDRYNDTEWFERFSEGFLATVDHCAERRIARARIYVAIKTGAVRIAAVDSIIVSVHATWLVGDIARIYHLSTGPVGVALILGHAFSSVYLAGQIGEGLEGFAEASPRAVGEASGDGDGAGAWLLDRLGATPELLDQLNLDGDALAGLIDGVSDVGGSALRWVSPKIAEGLLNGFFVSRLGRATQDLVRPIRRGNAG